MEIKETLRQCAEKYARLNSAERIKRLYSEVINYAASQANMGNFRARFDAYWDNNPETREVCRMLHQDGLLDTITTYAEEDAVEDVNITESILNTDAVSPENLYICALYLTWM